MTRPMRLATFAVSVYLAVPTAVAPPPATTQREVAPIVIDGTQEAALGQPRVHVQLGGAGAALKGKPEPSPLDPDPETDRPVRSFIAFLDTGASGYLISKSTAERFGVKAEPDAIYHEVGLHGATQVGVSTPYTLALADFSGALDEQAPVFEIVQKNSRLQLSLKRPEGLLALAGPMDVAGMPAIGKMVVEIDPTPMRPRKGSPNAKPDIDLESLLGGGPAVKLHDRKARPKASKDRELILIALEYNDYNLRKHPDNRGPLPELAASPVIPNIVSRQQQTTFTGNWLLDTGAAASIVSVKHAQALGIYKEDGTPARAADFTVPLGGIGGEGDGVKPADGYIIDSITIKARDGKTLEFRNVHIVVKDVGTKLDDGREVILDGVLGMNLLLPSASGLGKGLPTKIDDGPFERIWIDGPRAMVILERRK